MKARPGVVIVHIDVHLHLHLHEHVNVQAGGSTQCYLSSALASAASSPVEPAEPSNLHLHSSVDEASPGWDISDPVSVGIYADSERRHFWFRARNHEILQFLRRDGVPPPARVLEVGCGAGNVLSALSEGGYEVAGVEMHAELGRRAARAVPAAMVWCLDVTRPPAAFTGEPPFDVVGLFDVIEHVEAPDVLLRASAKRLRPGGLLCGTVPALGMLWSDYDVVMGHRRRYTPSGLGRLLDGLGAERVAIDYFFHVLLPGLAVRSLVVGRGTDVDVGARRRIMDRALQPPLAPINALFELACGAERWLRRRLPLGRIAGTSLWFSGRVPDPAVL